MEHFIWSEEYSVGMESVDHQHQQLIGLLNNLIDAVAQNNLIVIGLTLNGLIMYTMYHFRHEESLFEKYKYPDCEKHKGEHAWLATKVTEFNTGLKRGENVGKELVAFLKLWLSEHILKSDMAFSTFLQNAGAT